MMVSPSEQVLASANEMWTTLDGLGRRLTLRKINALDRLRLFKTLGPTLAQNSPYLGMAMLAVAVTTIDDIPIPPPVTESQLEGLVARLGNEGIAAVARVLSEANDASHKGHSPGN